MDVEAFWKYWEAEAESFEDVQQLIYDVFEQWSEKGRQFAWRGQVDASWPLHSSLYRRLLWTQDAEDAPRERKFYDREGRILTELHRWGLHMGEYGRLSILNQLAMLQHHGAPTRLIDITFNPFIGLWFATEEKYSEGELQHGDEDARLFAIDVTERLINERDDKRDWEDSLSRPWPGPIGKDSTEDEVNRYKEWTTSVVAWRPPHFHPRMSAQNGGFVISGVPATQKPGGGTQQWPKNSDSNSGRWKIDEVRRATSIALRPHKLTNQGRDPSKGAVYTIRIKSDAKEEIRSKLSQLFGYKHSTIYSDYTGFASFATPKLRETPA